MSHLIKFSLSLSLSCIHTSLHMAEPNDVVRNISVFTKIYKFFNRDRQQDLMNLLGAMYAAVMFLGGTNTSAVQSVVAVERTVFYREKAAGMYSAIPYAFAQVKKIKY